MESCWLWFNVQCHAQLLVGVVVAVHPLVRTCVPFVPLLASCGRLCRKLRGPSVRCDAVQHLLCKPAFRHARCECDPHLLALTVSTCPMHVYSVVVSCRAGNGAAVCVCVVRLLHCWIVGRNVLGIILWSIERDMGRK